MTRNIVTRSNLERFQLSGDRRALAGPSQVPTTQRCRTSRSFCLLHQNSVHQWSVQQRVEGQTEDQGDLDDLEPILRLLGSVMITEHKRSVWINTLQLPDTSQELHLGNVVS